MNDPLKSQEAPPYDDGLDDMREEERQLRQDLAAIQRKLSGASNPTAAEEAKFSVVSDAIHSDDPAACIRAIVESEDVSLARSEAAERLVQLLHLELSG